MSFLQPLLLWALPLAALPILIHLLNQRRFQTMEWGAMAFLLAANRMSRGFARVRRWLILAARVLVLLGLLIALARPLASGWLGLAAGNRIDTTIILFDRSPSMSASAANNAVSKLETGRQRLADALQKLRSDHWVLIDSATQAPIELESAQALLSATTTEPSATSADLPAMLQTAHHYISANQTGRTDIWICSDLRKHDWDPDGGRWRGIRDSFADLSQSIRIYLLAYPQTPSGNLSLRVSDVARKETPDGAALVLSLRLQRGENERQPTSIPVQFEIDGALSTETVEMTASSYELKNYEIPLGDRQIRGWGRVSIPADANAQDNDFFLVFDRESARRTLVVSDDPHATGAFALAAEIPAKANLETVVEVTSSADASTMDWDEVGLIIWHAPLPDENSAGLLSSFVDQGGYVLLLPPRSPGTSTCFGVQWQSWVETNERASINSWRGDADLLAHTQDGSALPVGELKILRACGMVGEFIPLAMLADGQPILVRVPSARGGIYALATTASPECSSLAADGVMLYVMVQRALALGSARLAAVHQAVAGSSDVDSRQWLRVVGAEEALSSEYRFQAGVFKSDERFQAQNRSAQEDEEFVLAADQADALFGGLDFVRLEDEAARSASLIQEIWRLFLVAMIFAMLAEAAMCMPKPRVRERSVAERMAA